MARVYQRTILRYRKRRAMGPTITITVTPARDSDGRKAHAAPGQLFDGLGERLVISRSTQPFLDACRLLLSEGANPSTPVAMRHQPQAFPEFLEIPVRARAQARTTTPCASTIGAAAGLTVEEGERRPTFRRWKPGRRGRQPAHASNRKGRDLAQDRLAAEYPPGQPSPERRTRSVNFFLGGGPKGGPEFAARRDHRSSGARVRARRPLGAELAPIESKARRTRGDRKKPLDAPMSPMVGSQKLLALAAQSIEANGSCLLVDCHSFLSRALLLRTAAGQCAATADLHRRRRSMRLRQTGSPLPRY
jgi:hypothetical protein